MQAAGKCARCETRRNYGQHGVVLIRAICDRTTESMRAAMPPAETGEEPWNRSSSRDTATPTPTHRRRDLLRHAAQRAGEARLPALRVSRISDQTQMVLKSSTLRRHRCYAPCARRYRTSFDTPPIVRRGERISRVSRPSGGAASVPALPVADEDGRLWHARPGRSPPTTCASSTTTASTACRCSTCSRTSTDGCSTPRAELKRFSGELVLACPRAGLPAFSRGLVICGNQPEAIRTLALERAGVPDRVRESGSTDRCFRDCRRTCVIATPHDPGAASGSCSPRGAGLASAGATASCPSTSPTTSTTSRPCSTRYRSYPILDGPTRGRHALALHLCALTQARRARDHNELASPSPGVRRAPRYRDPSTTTASRTSRRARRFTCATSRWAAPARS